MKVPEQWVQGSSPLARGGLAAGLRDLARRRLIPARAGRTLRLRCRGSR